MFLLPLYTYQTHLQLIFPGKTAIDSHSPQGYNIENRWGQCMTTDLENAWSALVQEGCTCVLCKGDVYYKSTRRGVAPLMGWLEEGLEVQGFSAADKVVGRATAMLYCLLGVSAVRANVISDGAVEIFQQNHIPVFWNQRVSAIQNRAGDGLCPMEQATRDICDPAQAPDAIRAALARLTNSR